MKGRQLIAARHPRGEIAALMVDGRLDQLSLSLGQVIGAGKGESEAQTGAIFLGQVERLLSGGAFLRLDDAGLRGFLPDAADLAPGDRLLVEVTRPAEQDKAARLSARVSLRNGAAVLTLGAPGINVSRAIGDKARKAALLQLAQECAARADLPAPPGLVIRTAAARMADDEVAGAIAALFDDMIVLAGQNSGNPRCLRAAPGPLQIALADWVTTLPVTALIGAEDGPWLAQTLKQAAPVLELPVIQAEADPLEESGLRDAIELLLSKRVPLPGCAGDMVLERTEALICVDVNTGPERNALPINLAAAKELTRHLRLRGWGGMLVVDFAPMREGDRARVEAALRAASDKSWRHAGWGPLGLYEARLPRMQAPLELVWKEFDNA
ncbi:MAG: ribonuclease E/G [Neomegalonema sp.]|nr:ribonuclease E/G [Neomegalonema sp.]